MQERDDKSTASVATRSEENTNIGISFLSEDTDGEECDERNEKESLHIDSTVTEE